MLLEFPSRLRVNGLGVFLGCKHAVLAMRQQRQLDHPARRFCLRGRGGSVAYTASKAACASDRRRAALCRGLRSLQLRASGYIDTDDRAVNSRYRQHDGPPVPRAFTRWAFSEPRKDRRLVLFLLSDESSFSTGAEFVADGKLGLGGRATQSRTGAQRPV
jgi:3alpha(or 20beta)-hydroxysteroid dehydrogenase